MKPLALLLLILPPFSAAAQTLPISSATSADDASTTTAQTPTPPPGSLESSKIRLDAHDEAGALADAETALAHGGGADAYAARGDAKRALGRPMAEVIADYAEAAKLDPRYIEKYKGLIEQGESESHPDTRSKSWGRGLNGLPIGELGAAVVAGGGLIAVAMVMLRKRAEHPLAPDDEQVKPEGKEKEAGEGHPKAGDLEQPPPKKGPEPPAS